MKITKNEIYYVEKEGTQYTRHSSTSWTIVMGESDEQVYGCGDLEKEFQSVLAKTSKENLNEHLKRTFHFDYIIDIRYKGDNRVGELSTAEVVAWDEEHAVLLFKKDHPGVPFDPPY